MNHFRQIGHYDIGGILGALYRNLAKFSEQTWRQDYPGSAHPDSETIYLRLPPVLSVDSMFNSLEVADLPIMAEDDLRTACEAAAAMAGGPLARAMLVNLKAGGVVTPHIDQGTYAEATERYHLPIITSPDALMTVMDERLHMPAGTVWWFDKHSLHSVENKGPDRVHLIIDVFA